MALTVTVTKIEPSVSGNENEDYTIRMMVTLLDNSVSVRQQEFSCTMSKNEALVDPNKAINKLLDQINPWILSYKRAKTALAHVGYETIRAGVQAGVTL